MFRQWLGAKRFSASMEFSIVINKTTNDFQIGAKRFSASMEFSIKWLILLIVSTGSAKRFSASMEFSIFYPSEVGYTDSVLNAFQHQWNSQFNQHIFQLLFR